VHVRVWLCARAYDERECVKVFNLA